MHTTDAMASPTRHRTVPVGDGFVITQRTWRLLAHATLVTVVTNSRAVPGDFFQTAAPGVGDVFVVFNRHRFTFDDRLAARTIWVHRLDEASGTFFGDSPADDATSRAFHRLYVAGDAPEHFPTTAGANYASYRGRLPGIAGYPVGRRLPAVRGKVRRIVSPSTGFLVFAWLEALQRLGAGFRTRAIGVGREYDGWPGHDWEFERRHLRRSVIDFRTPDGRPDRWYGLLDAIPYGLVRTAWKMRALNPFR